MDFTGNADHGEYMKTSQESLIVLPDRPLRVGRRCLGLFLKINHFDAKAKKRGVSLQRDAVPSGNVQEKDPFLTLKGTQRGNTKMGVLSVPCSVI